MLKPVTEAVIDPNVEAARAVVPRWPIATTVATTSEYSNKWVLENQQHEQFHLSSASQQNEGVP
jgi:hypothetical protein